MTAISDKYALLGGPTGPLGPPLTGEEQAAGGGLKQQFSNATIYWHARTGAFEVHGAIHGTGRHWAVRTLGSAIPPRMKPRHATESGDSIRSKMRAFTGMHPSVPLKFTA